MKTLNELDTLASNVLHMLPELMKAGTVYANDLVHRFITYIILFNGVKFVCYFFVFILLCFINYKCYKICANGISNAEDGFYKRPYIVGFTLITFITICVHVSLAKEMFDLLNNCIQAYFVPELFIANYFKMI